MILTFQLLLFASQVKFTTLRNMRKNFVSELITRFEKLRILKILLYKNYLVRKRRWKLGLFSVIVILILIILSAKLVSTAPKIIKYNITHPVIEEYRCLPITIQLYYTPDTDFLRPFMSNVENCIKDIINNAEISMIPLKTEEEIIETYKAMDYTEFSNMVVIATIIDSININNSTSNLKYTIRTSENIPKALYSGIMGNYFCRFTVLQFCLDKSFINIKAKDINFVVRTQKMPTPAHVDPNNDYVFRRGFCAYFQAAFLIVLSLETLNSSDEKFLGINVLMAMNGIRNYLNLLSWLFSGIVFSCCYTIPIIILLNISYTKDAFSFLHYGNSFIIWLVLTCHVGHAIAFGMHVSAYFTRSSYMIIGLLIPYVVSNQVAENYGIEENPHPSISYFGIFFPNILLFRACEEINYYESMMKGSKWNNLFVPGVAALGFPASLGMIIIFSIIGTIFHIILANYVHTINPGKYGTKKNPFYFLEFLCKFKKSRRSSDANYNEIEDLELNDNNKNLFEPVAQGVYTPGIQVRNLKKTYSTSLFRNKKVHAVKNISIDFFQGEITALLGHNGAGKSTTMMILSGMINPSEGSVFINNKNVSDYSDEILSDMGLCPQENLLFPSLSVAEQLKFFAMLKHNTTAESANDDIKTVLKNLQLSKKRNALPEELSGGQKRRVCLGMALIGDPSILILDEPTSGLDPESRRDVWNTLLELRGKKTVLISTHDMEEADILGDRIAIIHSGHIKSYGTSMFLKKMLGGENVEVTFSTEPWCDPKKIKSFVAQGEIYNIEDGKIEMRIPNTPQLPDLLDKIESNEKALGISGMSVTLITLEKVFLRLTQEDADNTRKELHIETIEKQKGSKRFLYSIKALILKKMTFTSNNLIIVLAMVMLITSSLLGLILALMYQTNVDRHPRSMPINLNMYPNPKTYYRTESSETKAYGDTYKLITEKFEGKIISNNFKKMNITNALLHVGAKDIVNYLFHLIAAAEFQSRNSKTIKTIALYNDIRAQFALPVSVNLISNTLLRTLNGEDSHISVSVQPLPQVTAKFSFQAQEYNLSVSISLFFCLVYVALALFIMQPLKETRTSIKHLQRMAGASAFLYWGTMFAVDFIMFMGLAMYFILGFLIIFEIIGIIEFLIMALLFALLAINILPIIYIFSFWKKSTRSAIIFLSSIPSVFIISEGTLTFYEYLIQERSDLKNLFKSFVAFRQIQKIIFSPIPYISFLHGILSFFKTARKNSVCREASRIMTFKNEIDAFYCKDLKCYKGKCENPLTYFNKKVVEKDIPEISLETSITMLYLTSILCIVILFILEYKLFPRLLDKIYCKIFIEEDTNEINEEHVQKMKDEISLQIYQIQNPGANENVENENEDHSILLDKEKDHKYIFLVYELRKKFKKFVAVKDISFGVKQKECFGLLGVNGAGKSTTFKMMTGEEIPNKGMIYLDDKDVRKHRNDGVSQMGYCPQTDALIASLNCYDHLRLFARLRGIPEDKIETEVNKWIDGLELNFCASKPSCTYSGGNKRRLSVAIAVIGAPSLVLLDEPTAGVDPASRRSVTNVIQAYRNSGHAIILTSHSMEECEALCSRLAIMVDGKLCCIGPAQELKQQFGAGHNIQLKLNAAKSKDQIDLIKAEINETLNGEIMDENLAYLLYHIKSTTLTWKKMYNVMNGLKNKYECIEDFYVMSATLEQLFLMFAKTSQHYHESD